MTIAGARISVAAGLLVLGLLRAAGAAEVRLDNFEAQEDHKHVVLRFTFADNWKLEQPGDSYTFHLPGGQNVKFTAKADADQWVKEHTALPVKPDLTYQYNANYVGLRISGLRFTGAQLDRGDIPPPSSDARQTYRSVRFVQDKESGEIRVYLTKPLTPADAQVVPFDTYTEVTLLKPNPGKGDDSAPDTTDTPAPLVPEHPTLPAPQQPQVTPQQQLPVTDTQPDSSTSDASDSDIPTLRNGEVPVPPPTPQQVAPSPPEPVVPAPQSAPTNPASSNPAASKPPKVIPTPPQTDTASRQQTPPAQEPSQPTPQRLGGPSYTDFDLDKVPVNQLTFKGKPFREAILDLVAGTGYNVVVSDEVDNSEVYLNFNQKQLSLKSALDLLSLTFDLDWSVQPDAIVIKAKPAQP